MDLQRIVQELTRERDRLGRAIAALTDSAIRSVGRTVSSTRKAAARGRLRRKRHLTPEGRKRLSQMMKKRWAERRRAAKTKG